MRQAGRDATLEHMLKMNRPLTVETYLAMNYPDGTPPMTAELWAEIPEMLREKEQSSDLRSETEEEGISGEYLRRAQVRKMVADNITRSQGMPIVPSKAPPVPTKS